MEVFLILLALALCIVLVCLLWWGIQNQNRCRYLEEQLEKYSVVIDAEGKAAEILDNAKQQFDAAKNRASQGLKNAEQKAQAIIRDANEQATSIEITISTAKSELEQYRVKIDKAEKELKKVNKEIGSRGNDLGNLRRVEREEAREKESMAIRDELIKHASINFSNVADTTSTEKVRVDKEQRKEWTQERREEFKDEIESDIEGSKDDYETLHDAEIRDDFRLVGWKLNFDEAKKCFKRRELKDLIYLAQIQVSDIVAHLPPFDECPVGCEDCRLEAIDLSDIPTGGNKYHIQFVQWDSPKFRAQVPKHIFKVF